MTKTRLFRVWGALIFLVFFCSANALADDTQDQKNWQFNLAPFYLWGVSIDGNLQSGSSVAQLDVPFGDIFDSLEAAFIVHVDVLHKSNFGFILDINAMDISSSGTIPTGLTLDVGLKVRLAEFSGFYRIQRGNQYFDAILGMRYVELSPKITPTWGPTLLDESQDWTDPIIGGRYIWNFSEGWSVVARGDIGGFGVGSEFSWQAFGLVEWQPFKNVSFLAGYRALYEDYETGTGPGFFSFDSTLHGPVLGLNFKW